MLTQVFDISNRINELHRLAEDLDTGFEAREKPPELLRKLERLESGYNVLITALPQGVVSASMGRHLHFLRRHLQDKNREACRRDASDLVRHDIPGLGASFRSWCTRSPTWDQELRGKVMRLIEQQEYDSAVRKGFVVLSERLRKKAKVTSGDGVQLVNAVFGSEGVLSGRLEDSQREGLRSLGVGLYSVFRNQYHHNDVATTYAESEAVLGMISCFLSRLDAVPSRKKRAGCNPVGST